MSLLNDMLKDLDKRSSRQASSLSLPGKSGISIKPLVNTFTAAVLIFAMLFLFAVVYWPKQTKPVIVKADPVTAQIQSISPAPAVALNTGVKSEPTPMEKDVLLKENRRDNSAFATEDKDLITVKLAHITREDSRDKHINQALEAIQDGNDQEAMMLLDAVLGQFPTSLEARENLAALYFSHDDVDHAYKILNDGLKLMPHSLNLVIMKARFLVEQKKYSTALQLLEGFNPNMNSKPEFYALLAAIFEATNRTNEAGGLYQALIKVDPSNGQYWLGLGIALEQKKLNNQAVEAYKRASQSENVPSSSRSYAENRLHILQG